MLEVMDYLRESGFRTRVVTDGGQEFLCVYSEEVYGVPIKQVVGSSIATESEYQGGEPALMREPKVFFIDDKAGKAVGINLFIGKRGGRRRAAEDAGLHDDAERAYAYGPANGLPDTKVGTSQELLDEAKERGWVVISMKDDWKTVFAKP